MRQQNGKRGRSRGRNKGGSQINRTLESNGPDVKIRGTAAHIYEKYQALARDAHSSGDRVAAESYLQHAEHYWRLMALMGPQAGQPGYQQGQGHPGGYMNGNGADTDDDGGDEPMPQQGGGAPHERAGEGQGGAHLPAFLQSSAPGPEREAPYRSERHEGGYRGERGPREDRYGRDDRPVRDDRPPREDRQMREDRPRQHGEGRDRPMRGDRPDRPERQDRPDRPDRQERFDRGPRPERAERGPRPDQGERAPRHELIEREDAGLERQLRVERPEAPAESTPRAERAADRRLNGRSRCVGLPDERAIKPITSLETESDTPAPRRAPPIVEDDGDDEALG